MAALTQVVASSGGAAIGIVGAVIIGLVIEGLILMGIFRKANEPLWAAFIPIVNLLYILKIVGRPWWWIFLFLIPCLGFIIWIVVAYDLAQSFGHGIGFTLGLIFLNVIFLLILSYSSAQYRGRPGSLAYPEPPMS